MSDSHESDFVRVYLIPISQIIMYLLIYAACEAVISPPCPLLTGCSLATYYRFITIELRMSARASLCLGTAITRLILSTRSSREQERGVQL